MHSETERSETPPLPDYYRRALLDQRRMLLAQLGQLERLLGLTPTSVEAGRRPPAR